MKIVGVINMLEFFAIKSKDGKYFRNKDYDYSGNGQYCWVDDIKKARIYSRIGSAKAVASWWANHYPQYGAADIVRLPVEREEVVVVSDLHKIQIRKLKKDLSRRLKTIKYFEEHYPQSDISGRYAEVKEIPNKNAEIEFKKRP